MNKTKLSLKVMLLAPAIVAGCGGGGSEEDSSASSGSSGGSGSGSAPSLPFTTSSTLLSSFVTSWDSFRSSATSLLTNDARYTRQTASGYYADQNGNNRFDAGVDVRLEGNPIEHAGIHYAHAAGLTGAGEVIAFTDSGFLASHEVFAGKSVTTGAGLQVTDHGTFVASVAAGNSASMIGVAPEADVIFGSWTTGFQKAATANAAAAAGAVALNNSWGYDGLYANSADYNSYFSSSSEASYLTALKNYATDGIVLFSISNDHTISNVGLLPGLPVLEPSLEESWLAVVNGVPVLSGDDIVAASRVSGACLEAAAWCIAANGSWTGANSDSNSSYAFGTGTSFAAPTVAGALALLAEAFPSMTHQELRVRLLASADNDFSGFTQSGTVELVPGFEHAYSSEWGHGFLDVAAALLPIGQATVTMGNGTVLSAEEPIVISGSASGDAVARALSGVDLVSRDTLSAGFVVDASQMVATRNSAPIFSLNDVLQFDYEETASFGGTAFFGESQAIPFLATDGNFDFTLYQSQTLGDHSIGFGVSRGFDLGDAKLKVSATYGDDTSALLSDWNGGTSTSIFSVDMALSAALSETSQIKFEVGYAMGQESSSLGQAADVVMTASALSYSQQSVWKRDDSLSLSVSIPAAISSGSTSLSLPVAFSGGETRHQNVNIDLSPEEREVRISLDYERPLTKKTNFGISLAHAENRGNIAGNSETAVLIGFKARF